MFDGVFEPFNVLISAVLTALAGALAARLRSLDPHAEQTAVLAQASDWAQFLTAWSQIPREPEAQKEAAARVHAESVALLDRLLAESDRLLRPLSGPVRQPRWWGRVTVVDLSIHLMSLFLSLVIATAVVGMLRAEQFDRTLLALPALALIASVVGLLQTLAYWRRGRRRQPSGSPIVGP